MKYLILAYGSEKDWHALSRDEQQSLLAQDEVLRNRGSLVAAVENAVTVVRAWDGTPTTTNQPLAHEPPLAGFGIIEAEDLAQAIELVTHTPCARAGGAVEIRPIMNMNPGARVVL